MALITSDYVVQVLRPKDQPDGVLQLRAAPVQVREHSPYM